jgi:Cu+-exporting ATPase
MTKDPVCYSEVDEHQAIARGMFSSHKNETYYFCGPECLSRFRENPDEYASQVTEWEASYTMTDDYLG